MTDALVIKHLGCKPYLETWQAMKTFTDERNERTLDECWVVEHPPVLTLGQAGKEAHILTQSSIPIVKTDRGGQVTYHGPGQVMLYCLLDLKRKGIGVKELVSRLEQVVIDLLADYGVNAARKAGAPGVYVDEAKISALGLRVRKGRSYHGLALNVDADLSAFDTINPCGSEGLKTVNLQSLLDEPLVFDHVADDLLNHFCTLFDYHKTRSTEPTTR